MAVVVPNCCNRNFVAHILPHMRSAMDHSSCNYFVDYSGDRLEIVVPAERTNFPRGHLMTVVGPIVADTHQFDSGRLGCS